jgi:SH3-like domain-containing protein
MRFIVVKDWVATYANPISISAGEQVELTGRQEDWDGHIWLWAKSADGLEGWIPDSLFDIGKTLHLAKDDYTAVELSCQTGQVLSGIKDTHGWVYCRSADGRLGWVPRRNLEQL